jgi:hypothetical protein
MSCACKAIVANYGGCIGQFTACEGRCRPLQLISTARETRVPSCWDKTRPSAGTDGTNRTHGEV